MAFPFLTKNVRDFKYIKQKKNNFKNDMEEFNQNVSYSFESNLIKELVNQNNPKESQTTLGNKQIHAVGAYSIPGQTSLQNNQQIQTFPYQSQNQFYAYNNYFRNGFPSSNRVQTSNQISNMVNNNYNPNNIIHNSYGNIINVDNFNKKSKK